MPVADDRPRGLAPTAHVETAEGPVTMAETPNKGFAVMTRVATGGIGFRQLMKLVTSGPVPMVRVVLASGHRIECAAGHPFFRVGMEPVAAADLRAGDRLETAFGYPAGYVPPDVPQTPPAGPIAVARVEPAGDGMVMTGTVRDTHVLYLTAGVLCGE